jgi:ATP-binding cassette subfamily B protein
MVLVLIVVFSKKARPLFRKVQERLEKVNMVMQENIAGVRLVRAFVRSDYEKNRFSNRNEEFTEKGIQVNRMLALLMPTMILILNLGMAALLWFGGNMVIGGSLTTGQIVAFSNYLMMTMFPVLLLGMILPQYYAATASIDRVAEVLETKTTLVYPQISEHRISKGEVTFENVCLDYDGIEGEHAPVLQGLSFDVQPGQMVAILGATGSGKTSLVNMIPRLYDPTKGRVLIDGVDLKEYTQTELRRNIALALQNAVLFSGTIADNIRFGRPEATDEEVMLAAKAAQAHDFIMAKEGGYQAEVSQRGANFSGGQKQRLAIARALCIDPQILILDDSTSAVDVETEVDIQKALGKLMKGRTSFVVAQRISTVLRADRIFVLDNGRIAADGTHCELIETSPIYQAIYHSQLGNGVLTLDDHVTSEVNNA